MKETNRATQIAQDIYEVKLPLAGSSLKELSSYIIRGKDRSCVIDVGFETEECETILKEALEELEIPIRNTDILLTHSHRDHCGNLPNLYPDAGTIYCSEWDRWQITGEQSDSGKDYLVFSFLKCGIPMALLEGMPKEKDLSSFIPGSKVKTVRDGDFLSYGRYKLKVIDLKGHMPGMIGFFDEEEGILFPGDHVLNRITPNIGFYREENRSLHHYIKNLKKIRNLKTKYVFPAHRGEIRDLAGRVDEILEHHESRLEEIISILSLKPMCAYEVAGKAKWYYKEGNFRAYPVVMKWMATSEILAHLQYLYEKGEAGRSGGVDETYIYYLL